jgi:hypothetical protein
MVTGFEVEKGFKFYYSRVKILKTARVIFGKKGNGSKFILKRDF